MLFNVLWLVGFSVTALLMEVASSGKPREIRGSVALYLWWSNASSYRRMWFLGLPQCHSLIYNQYLSLHVCHPEKDLTASLLWYTLCFLSVIHTLFPGVHIFPFLMRFLHLGWEQCHLAVDQRRSHRTQFWGPSGLARHRFLRPEFAWLLGFGRLYV